MRFSDDSPVGAVAEELFQRGQAFETVSGTAILDAVLERLKVRSVRRLFPSAQRALPPGLITKAAAERAAGDGARRFEARLAALRSRFGNRARRAQGVRSPRLDNIYRIEIGGSVDLAYASAELARDPQVLYAEPELTVETFMVPDDPYYSSSGSWGQADYDLWGLKQIRAELAWNSYSGAGMVVAVTDTGIDYTHPDIAANMWTNGGEIPGNGVDDDANDYVDDVYGYDFYDDDSDPRDYYGHGTHVAGTIAATGNNGLGIIGVAHGARVMAVKGFPDDSGSGSNVALYYGILYAVDNGADVINASWGGPGKSSLIQDAVNYAVSQGCVFVCAAGNNAVDARHVFPANVDGAIVVGALGSGYEKASYSNFGGKVDVFAPGGNANDILSLLASGSYFANFLTSSIVGGAYFRANGTSIASPHVAGLVALLLQKDPALSPEQVRYLLRTTAWDVHYAGWEESTTWGRIDCQKAVSHSGAPPSLQSSITSPALWKAYPEGWVTKGQVSVLGTATAADFARYELAYAARVSSNAPPSFTTLAQSSTPVVEGLLGVVNTAGWAATQYFLRLRVYDTAGRYSDSITLISVDPTIKTGWPQAAAPYWLSLAPNPRTVIEYQDLVFADLDHDGTKEVMAVYDRYLYVWRQDGTSFNAAFPKYLSSIRTIAAAPAVADLDGDGDEEIVLVAQVSPGQDPLYAFHHDGTLVAGFPAGNPDPAIPGYVLRVSTLFSPVVADLDADGAPEIVFNVGTYNYNYAYSYLVVVDRTGRMKPGWPQVISSNLADEGDRLEPPTAVVVADLNGDHVKELLVGRTLAAGEAALAIYSSAGAQVREVAFGSDAKYIEPVYVADLDHDGAPEIFAAMVIYPPSPMVGKVYLLDGSGTILPGWPQTTLQRSSLCFVADLDGDGDLEVAGSGGAYWNEIWALNLDGSPVTGYPRTVSVPAEYRGYLHGSQLSVAHLDAATPAIFSGDYSRGLYGFNAQGNQLPGWPKPVVGGPGAPAVGDIDGNGAPEIGFQSFDGFIYLWQESASGTAGDLSEWPTAGGDVRRTGTPFVPKVQLAGYPSAFHQGNTTSVGLRWDDLPARERYRIVVLLRDGSSGAIAAQTTIESFDVEGATTLGLLVDAAAIPGTDFQLVARCERRADGAVVAETMTPSTLVIVDVLPPSVPPNLTATPVSSSRIDLAWDASTDDSAVASYEIARDQTVIASVSGRAFVDTGLGHGAIYQYQVRAVDEQGNRSAFGSPVTATTWPNQNPSAADDAVSTFEDTPVTVAVLANDSDADGDTLALAGITQPSHGAAAANPDGSVTYTPSAGYRGNDSFTYTTTDGHGGSAFAAVTLTVTEPRFTLGVTVSGQGAVTLEPPGGTYASGTSVTLTATAAAGWHFDHWEGALVGSTNPATLPMDGNKALTAVFVHDQYLLSLTTVGQGDVALDPSGGIHLSGTTVTFTATAAAGWHFARWDGALTGSMNPTMLLMDGNKAVNATFTSQECLGTFRPAQDNWLLDRNGNWNWDHKSGGDARILWPSRRDDIPAAGDWNRDGRSDLGTVRIVMGRAVWLLDANANGIWDPPPAGTDVRLNWPWSPGSHPVVADWNRDGFADDPGIFRVMRDGTASWLLDANGNKTWDGWVGGDRRRVWTYVAGDRPAVGDWNRDGFVDNLGVSRTQRRRMLWRLDANGNDAWNGNGGGDLGIAWPRWLGAVPVVGDWNKDGYRDDLGVYRPCFGKACWHLDTNGNKSWNGPPGGDKTYLWPLAAGDVPVQGAWYGRDY